MARQAKLGSATPAKLLRFSAAMTVIGARSPHRMSISQCIFFVTSAKAILAGERPTYTFIKEQIGEDVQRALNSTYRILCEPSERYPNALNWLKRSPSRLDAREKIFDLTDEGRKVAEEVISELGGEL